MILFSQGDPFTLGEAKEIQNHLKPKETISICLSPQGSLPFEERKKLLEIGIKETLKDEAFSFVSSFEALPDETCFVELNVLKGMLQKGLTTFLDKKEVFVLLPYDFPRLFRRDFLPYLKENYHLLYLEESLEEIQKGNFLGLPYLEIEEIISFQAYSLPYLRSMLKEHRYLHSLSVAKTAYAIAQQNGYNPVKAFVSGLYHDCGKDVPLAYQKEVIANFFSSYEPVPEFAYHQFVGSYLAKEIFKIHDEEVLSSIRFHCTGKAKMSTLEKIVYAADKVEPNRDFPTQRGREACLEDIEQGFVFVLREQVEYFKKKGISSGDYPLTKEMYQHYLGDHYAE